MYRPNKVGDSGHPCLTPTDVRTGSRVPSAVVAGSARLVTGLGQSLVLPSHGIGACGAFCSVADSEWVAHASSTCRAVALRPVIAVAANDRLLNGRSLG
jgi:hypothetical protein